MAHLAIGAASKRITDLEESIGSELLKRHYRGVTLTPAGQALQRHAQLILRNVDHLAADLSDYAAGIVGIVRLAANTSAVTQFLPGDIAAFTAGNPRIKIELEELNSSEIVNAVLDGRADIGIFADRTPPLGLQTVTYRRDQLALVVPTTHPLARRKKISFVEASDLEFVSLSKGTSLSLRLESCAEELGKRLRVRIQVRSFDAMCQMVASGLGVAVLPATAVKPHLRSMGLRKVDLTDAWAERHLLVGARDLTALSRPVRQLMDHLVGQKRQG